MPSFLDPERKIDKHRTNLPHWQQEDTWIFVTWRLHDSLPQSKLARWREERKTWQDLHPLPWDERTEAEYHQRFSARIDEWLDAGSGSCVLREPENSAIVLDTLKHFDGVRYRLAAYVVMPNHVHVLFSPGNGYLLADILHSWKRHTARVINRRENRSGALWQADYWDTLIRSREHFDWVCDYMRKNPAGLAAGSYRLWIA